MLCSRCEKALRADESARLGKLCLSCAWGLAIDDEPPALPGLEILALIGRGGMGRVYKARQTALGRVVAVKLLSPTLAREPEFLRRFEREAKAVGQLDHPGVVRVHEFVPHPETPYLVLELIEGESLRKRLQRGPVPAAEAADVAARLCDALGAAHARGVTHRDLKPENVLLSPAGVKLVDFGLARPADDPRLTQPESRMGTPHYMAPEGAAEAGPAADLYSLGVMLYEMLSGRLPQGRFEPPPAYASLVLRLLDPDPKRRPSAVEVAKRLRRPSRAPWFAGAAAVAAILVALAWPSKPPAWEELPELSDAASNAAYPKVAPGFAAWVDDTNGARKVVVKAWKRSWETLGELPSAGHVSLRVDPEKRLVVSWRDTRDGNTWDVGVKRWDGRAWSGFGDGIGATPGNSWHPELALDARGLPVVVWQETEANGRTQVYLKRWTGSAWAEIGGSASAGGLSRSKAFASAPCVAVDAQDRPVVSWLEETGRSPIVLKTRRGSGSGWEELPSAGEGIAGLTMALVEGRPVLAWSVKREEREDIQVAAWNGTAWDDWGRPSAELPSSAARFAKLASDGRRLAVIWSTGSRARVKLRTSAGWRDPSAPLPDLEARFPDVAFDGDALLMGGYEVGDGRGRAFVRRLANP